MSVNDESLEKLSELLLAARTACSDTADPSVKLLLDQAICEVQQAIEKDATDLRSVRRKAWMALDGFFKSLPSIKALIDWLAG
jgi:hypothetical protein